jgi:ABC-type cobalamin/Fe3+-siderophores transport system ATPase subunit
MCYSGQCAMSAVVGSRSGNRGRCAKPCRLPYGMDKAGKAYPLSLKDNCLADDLAAMAEMGVAELAEQPLFSLSGGMRQKAYIAMALAQDTDYILLDEPATYLDISNQLELMQILRRLADGGKGIVTVTHDLPMAFGFSDAIAVLDKGKIALCDHPDGVCDAEILKALFGVSLKRFSKNGQYGYDF